MGIYPTNRYQIEILYQHFWEYVPFKVKEIIGREATVKLGRNLVTRGYEL